MERAPARWGPNIKKGPGAQGLKLNHARGDAGAVAGGLLLEGVVVDDSALGAGLSLMARTTTRGTPLR